MISAKKLGLGMDTTNRKIRPRLYLVFRLVQLCVSSLIMVLGAAAAGLYHKKDRTGAMKEVMIVVPVCLNSLLHLSVY